VSGKVLLIRSATDTRTTLAQRLCDALFDVCEQGFGYFGDLHLYDCVIVVARRISDIDALGGNFKAPQLPILVVLDRVFDGSPSAVLGTVAQDVLSSPLLKTEFLARVRGLIRRHTAQRELDRRANLNRAIGFNDPAQGFVTQTPVHVVTSGSTLPEFFKTSGFRDGNFRFVHHTLDQLRLKLTRHSISVVVLCYDQSNAAMMTNLVLDLRAHPNSR
jgi:DNA-binding response OmpR family regulator